METEVKEVVERSASTVDEHTKQIASLADSQVKIAESLAKISEKPPTEVAPLEEINAISKIANMEVFGLPVGAAAWSLAAAGLGDAISGLATGLFPDSIVGHQYFPAGLKLGLAWVTSKYGKKFMGAQGASFAALMFTVDAVQDLVDIRGFISNLFKPTTTPPAGRINNQYKPDVVIQANRVVDDYYQKAFGR